jgi:Asp-tRNA(Asn)/Glu-tRNA(Gln) amidotransferase A subunit family amidase
MADDLFFSTIPELNAMLTSKKVSAVELTKEFAARLESLGPKYNALALALTKDALKKAKDVDGDIKRERLRGPLQGIPYGVKDLLSYAKFPTTWGAKPYQTQQFDYTATAIGKIEKSGGLLTGKLAMVELAGGGGYRLPAASLFGPGKNPWDLARWSGGSSSGSGSAVAAGLVTYALGSETSGSILTPAAFCGVTGLRPTYGLVSRHGAMPLAWTMDKIGPMCRTAEDCGLVLQTIAGGDKLDPASAGKSFYYTPQYAREMKDLRIGVLASEFTDANVFAEAMAVVKAFGVTLVDVKLPEFPYSALTSTIVTCEGSSVFEPLVKSGGVDQLADPKQAAGLRAGLSVPAKDYLKAQRIRSGLQKEFHKLFEDLDAIVAPTRPSVASKIDESLDALKGGQLIPAGNLAGLPALSVPCGFVDGLPVGLQFCGPAWSENTLIALGKQFQSRTDWHKRRPPA